MSFLDFENKIKIHSLIIKRVRQLGFDPFEELHSSFTRILVDIIHKESKGDYQTLVDKIITTKVNDGKHELFFNY